MRSNRQTSGQIDRHGNACRGPMGAVEEYARRRIAAASWHAPSALPQGENREDDALSRSAARRLGARLACAATVAIALGSVAPRGAAAQQQQPREPRYAARDSHAEIAVTPGEAVHPLDRALEWSYRAQDRLTQIADYSCVMAKREKIDGQLTPVESMFLKVRHRPFSVYIYSLGPQRARGQEAIWVEGRHDGKVLAHTTGVRNRIAGTVALEPTSPRLMEGNLHPITNIGIANLTQKLIRLHEYERNYGECDVQFYGQAKVDDRLCTCVQVAHPVPRRNFRYHLVRVYYDGEWEVPIRFEGYAWPTQSGGQPPLVEEYTYRNLQPNVGLSDLDFDPRNPAYKFN